MTLAQARELLANNFGIEPEALIEQRVIATLPNGVVLAVKFVGLATDEHGDWIAVLRPGDVVDLYLVDPSRLSQVPS